MDDDYERWSNEVFSEQWWKDQDMDDEWNDLQVEILDDIMENQLRKDDD